MKSLNITIISMALIAILFSCNTDTKAKLSKLKKQQEALQGQITTLENELSSKGETLNSKEFKFVGLMDLKSSNFDHYIKAQGKLDGDQNVGVFAEAPGTIAAKFADVGQKVSKGQIMAQIDDKQYKSQLESLETQYKFAEEVYDKQKRLWDQKIGSEIQYLQSKTNKESLEMQIASLKEQIEKFKIKSPISGTIEECNIKVGGVVSPDPRQAAYRVVEFRNLKITAEISEAYSAKVQKGDKLVVEFPDLNRSVDAVISFVSNYINPVNRTFLIEARIPGNTADLKANMIAICQINDYHSNKAILVPMNIIQKDNDGAYVYVARQKGEYSAAFKQQIGIGNSYNGIAEVIAGLAEGDRVVSAGFQELVDGQYIRF